MIESFNEFLEKSYGVPVFEENENNSINDIEKRFDDFEKPDFVCDDPYLVKISSIVLKSLKLIDKDWKIYPYVIKTNNKKSVMIYAEGIYAILVKEGIEKIIALYNENPINNNSVKPYISISTRKRGFLNVVRTAVTFAGYEKLGIHEAYVWKEGEKAPAPLKFNEIVTAFMGEGSPGRRKTEKAIPREYAKMFLELYRDMDDREITNFMCENWFDETDEEEQPYVQIQKLYIKKDGTLPDPSIKSNPDILNAQARVTKTIRMALCGVTTGLLPDLAAKLQELWFFGAAKSGELSIEETSDKILVVTESTDEIDEAIENLDYDLDEERQIVSTMLKYVQSGGESTIGDMLRGYIGRNRCLLVPGVAGIGKSEGINKAVDETRAKEGIDYFNVPSVTTAQALYKQLYRYNDMVMIFEEAEKLLQDKDIVNMMKKALDPKASNRVIGTTNASAANASAGGKSNEFYDVLGKTRREMYFLEVGSVSEYDKKQKFNSEFKRIKELESKKHRASIGTEYEYPMRSDKSIREEVQGIVDEWEISQRKSQFPISFSYNGYWVVTTNRTINSFKNDSKLSDSWEALYSRCYTIDINPTQKVVWEWLKRKIDKSANDKSLDDEHRILPLVGKGENATLENVLSFLQSVMDGNHNKRGMYYGCINFRILVNIREIIDSPMNSEKEWKRRVLKLMLMDSERL